RGARDPARGGARGARRALTAPRPARAPALPAEARPEGSRDLGGPPQAALRACAPSLVVSLSHPRRRRRRGNDEWQEDARRALHVGHRVLPSDWRHLAHAAACRPRRREYDREHLRPGLARRPRRKAPEGLGRPSADNDSDRRPFAEIVPIDFGSVEPKVETAGIEPASSGAWDRFAGGL